MEIDNAKHLAALSGLKQLDLRDCTVESRLVRELRKALPKCEILLTSE